MFTYTAEELMHLDDVLEAAFLYRVNPSSLDPTYYEHLADCALDPPYRTDLDRAMAAEMLELADALRCGMTLGGGEELP